MNQTRHETDPRDLTGDGLYVEISTTLTALWDLIPRVRALTDTHQRGRAFVTPEMVRQQSQIHLKERRLARLAEIGGRPAGHGATAAPGNLNGINIDVEIWAALRHAAQWLNRHGATPTKLSDQADSRELITAVRRMLTPVDVDRSTKTLRGLLIDLRRVRDDAERFVAGPDHAELGDCPNCHRPTLIGDMVAGEITCGRDRQTGEFHPCSCPLEGCPCWTAPTTHRHVWYRTQGFHADGWYALAASVARQNPDANRPTEVVALLRNAAHTDQETP